MPSGSRLRVYTATDCSLKIRLSQTTYHSRRTELKQTRPRSASRYSRISNHEGRHERRSIDANFDNLFGSTRHQRFTDYLNQRILGQDALNTRLLIALLADGHLLVEGAPGLAKTTAIKTLAAGLEAIFIVSSSRQICCRRI